MSTLAQLKAAISWMGDNPPQHSTPIITLDLMLWDAMLKRIKDYAILECDVNTREPRMIEYHGIMYIPSNYITL